MVTRTVITVALIVAATLAGYFVRRRNWLHEDVARHLMTGVVVFGYSVVGFFSIWHVRLQMADIWLPAVGTVHVLVMVALSLRMGRAVSRDRRDWGVVGLTGAVGNTGLTMGQFIAFLMLGETGVGLGSIYGLIFYPLMVLVMYPIARHYSGDHRGSLARLMFHSIFNWRSIGLPISLAGLALSLARVPRPQWVSDYHVVPTWMYLVLPLAYFSIGLRLHVSSALKLKRLLAAVAGLRFVLSPLVALALTAATWLTPWPLAGAPWIVLMINSCVPTAITVVAVANMFHLRPRDTSVIMMVVTFAYLALVLPVVLWVLGAFVP